MIYDVSRILKSKPKLLYNFNTLLPDGHRIECLTGVDEVQLITVIISDRAWIQGTSELDLDNHVTNTDQLRECLSSDDGMEKLTSLKSEWASCILQLLQTVCPHVM